MKKLVKFFIVIILLGALGYFVYEKTELGDKIKEEIPKMKEKIEKRKASKTKNPAKEALSEKDVLNKETIDLETSSGAVLVGSIKKDDKGYYFLTETPLNITLTYYVEHPEYFENVIKLRMLDDEEDNINKSIYLNEVVTVYGEILNPRSAGTLYLYPYNVKSGKQVDKSYADGSITAPEDIFGEVDESKLPKKMNSTIEDNEYKYNFYMLSKETINRFDNDFIEFYLEFVDAFLNYETSIKCPNKNYADFLFSILDYSFPVFYADGIYDFSEVYNKKDKTISWSYTTKSKKEHDKLIKEFESSANEFLKEVKSTDSEAKKAQTIYHNLSKVITYNYTALETFENAESYYVYVKHLGICHSFAYAYNQLLTQVGVESTIASGIAENQTIGHIWSVIKVDGEYYFADPTYEISYKNGTDYLYYGMSIEQRKSTNEYNENNIRVGMYDSKKMKDFANFDKSLSIVE